MCYHTKWSISLAIKFYLWHRVPFEAWTGTDKKVVCSDRILSIFLGTILSCIKCYTCTSLDTSCFCMVLHWCSKQLGLIIWPTLVTGKGWVVRQGEKMIGKVQIIYKDILMPVAPEAQSFLCCFLVPVIHSLGPLSPAMRASRDEFMQKTIQRWIKQLNHFKIHMKTLPSS